MPAAPAPVVADSAAGPLPSPGLHPDYVKSERLGKRIAELCAWLNAGEHRLLEMIREFDREGLWQHEGICSCAHWLNWKCGIGMNAAREKVRVANALGKLPKTRERLRRGAISYSKVRAITRIATPENEEYLLMIARHGTAAHVEGLVSKYRRCTRPQDRVEAIRQHALRELECWHDERGVLKLRGRLTAEAGALLTKALDFAIEQEDAEAKAERRHLRAARPKDAGYWKTVELPPEDGRVRKGDLRYKQGPWEETRPWESRDARRADALVRIAESYLAQGPRSRSTADRFQVVVHVSAETLKASEEVGPVSAETRGTDRERDHVSAETGAAAAVGCGLSAETHRTGQDGTRVSAETCGTDRAGDHVPAETRGMRRGEAGVSAETPDLFDRDFSYIEDAPHVAAETARRIACDASILRVVDGPGGEPLDIGRKSRLIPPALRRALKMRDGGCRFPGCTHKYYVDGHHIHHWADGGETSLKNLVQLCRHHHRLVHEQGFGCERLPDGSIRFSNPIGLEIGRTVDATWLQDDADPVRWLRGELDGDLVIGPETCTSRWQGERIDWPLAVERLVYRERASGAPPA